MLDKLLLKWSNKIGQNEANCLNLSYKIINPTQYELSAEKNISIDT